MVYYRWKSFLLVSFIKSCVGNVRENNGGNCEGVTSCRPRCISFRLDRSPSDCKKHGVFSLEDDVINPWFTKKFDIKNCGENCINEKCNTDLPDNLAIRIGEEGYTGSYYNIALNLTRDDGRFTFCSTYDCPKDECAVPEQMGSELQIEVREVGSSQPLSFNESGFVFHPDIYIGLTIALKAAFVGPILLTNETNRFGPLHIEWMDDPTGCRPDEFSAFAPVAPPEELLLLSTNPPLDEELFCKGPDYNPRPLPVVSSAPTSSPSSSPSASPTSIADGQLSVLRAFYDSTYMHSNASSALHNWFDDDINSIIDYCSFTGITCEDGYVTRINLPHKELSGEIPETISDLTRLTKLNLTGNRISGRIPISTSFLTNLSHLDITGNKLTGPIPNAIGMRSHSLREIILANNDLHGTIPASLCNLKSTLVAFDFANNKKMKGEIPACFGDLNLVHLRLDNAGMTGEVPEALCGIRKMNGFTPNKFGCDSIACPAGRYQPVYGRQISNETPCIKCPSRSPSNVLGSTKCVELDGNTRITPVPSYVPTSIPSQEPSVGPTESMAPSHASDYPSTGPSRTLSVPPSDSPSPFPSQVPSKDPTLSPAPTTVFSSIPSATPSKTSFFQSELFSLQFASITRLMNQSEADTFEKITAQFAREHFASGNETDVTFLSQSLDPIQNDTVSIVGRIELRARHRFLEGASIDVLTVQMEATVDSNRSSLYHDITNVFHDKMSTYEAALADSLSLFEAPRRPFNGVAKSIDKPENISTTGYFLLIAAGAVVVAIVLAMLIRRTRQKNQNERTQLGARPSPAKQNTSTSSPYRSLYPGEEMEHGASVSGMESVELEYLEDLEDAITTGSDVHRCKSDLCLQCKAGNQSNHVTFVSVSDDVNTSPCVLPKTYPYTPNENEAMGPEHGDGPSNGGNATREGKTTTDPLYTAHDLALERREALLTIREERSSESSTSSFSVANSTLGETPRNLLDSLAYVATGEEDVIFGDHYRNDYYTSGEDENPDQTEEWSSLDDVSGDDISGQWRSKA